MDKKYFMLKLIPSRPDFFQTLTDEERAIMMQHKLYWNDLMNKGMVLVFGPVLDPQFTYGLGILSVNDVSEIENFITNDPASKISKYEYYQMLAVVPEK